MSSDKEKKPFGSVSTLEGNAENTGIEDVDLQKLLGGRRGAPGLAPSVPPTTEIDARMPPQRRRGRMAQAGAAQRAAEGLIDTRFVKPAEITKKATFTLFPSDLDLLDEVEMACMKRGQRINKSLLLRVAIRKLSELPQAELDKRIREEEER